jgi:3-phenylpropionate/trans-cinnamate dioxygenase ferredoxin reductase subunit
MLRLESWRAAQEQGAHAAACLLGEDFPYRRVPWFWSDQYDLGLQVAGLLPVSGSAVTRPVGDQGGFIECLFDEAGRLACAAGIGPGTTVARDIRLLEMLIAREMILDPVTLTDPSANLKQLLKAG